LEAFETQEVIWKWVRLGVTLLLVELGPFVESELNWDHTLGYWCHNVENNGQTPTPAS